MQRIKDPSQNFEMPLLNRCIQLVCYKYQQSKTKHDIEKIEMQWCTVQPVYTSKFVREYSDYHSKRIKLSSN